MKTRILPSLLSAAAIAVIGLTSNAQAQITYTWDGSLNNNWLTPENWVGDVAPVANAANTYVLGAVGTGSTTPFYNGADGGGAFWGSLVFEGSRAFDLGGLNSNRFYLNGNITNNSTSLQTISMRRNATDQRGMIVNLAAARTFNTASGDLLITGWVDAAGNTGNAINKTGSFTLTLASEVTTQIGNPWRINVNEGTLAIGTVNSLGAATSHSTNATTTNGFTVSSGASLAVGNLVTDGQLATMLGTTNFAAGSNIGFDTGLGTAAGNRAYTANITNTAQGQLGLLKMGNNTLTLSGTNTFTGNTTIRAGELSIASTAALPGWDTAGRYSVAAQAALAVGNSVTDSDVVTMLGTGNFAANSLIGFDTSDGNRTYSDNLTGARGLFKTGANTLTIDGSNSYTGTTRLKEGTLRLDSGLASGGLAMTGTSVLDLNGSNATFTSSVASGGHTATSGNTITDNAAGTGTSLITINNNASQTAGLGALVTDGATRKVGFVVINNEHFQQLLTNANNTFSGGIQIGDGAGVGTRFWITSYTGTTVNGTLTASQLGTGAVTVGTSAAGKGQIWLNPAAGTTIYNDIIFNTALGLDVAGGVRWHANNFTLAGTMTANLADASFFNNGAGGNNLNISGQITGALGLQLTATGFDQIVTLNNTGPNANDYNGNTSILRATSVLQLGADNQLPDGTGKGNVNAVGTLRMNGFSDSINGLTGNGTVHNNHASNASTLTLGAGDATASFSGAIADGAAATLAITKNGTGTQTLAGTNTYTGATTVNAGTLLINGSTAVGSAVSVNDGGTLGGTGTIGGAITVNSGGTLSPGNSIESLASGSNTWNGGGALTFEFSTNGSSGSAGTEWDLLTITGGLDLTGASSGTPFTINLVTMVDATTPGLLGSWNPDVNSLWAGFVTTTTGVTDFSADKFAFNVGDFENPLNGSFSVAVNGTNLDLVYTAIPEPATSALLIGSFAALMAFRRRRNS